MTEAAPDAKLPDTARGVHVFGIRHHGPGSARTLLRALEALQPDTILIEGPPDADDLIPLATAQMKPPVALLLYESEQPAHAVFYPFAEYSPEWQALRFAIRHRVPVRFMDLPIRHQLALDAREHHDEDVAPQTQTPPTVPAGDADEATALRRDPLGHLARAAGFDDGERWWEHMVEHRRQASAEVFAAVLEAMAALRAELTETLTPHDERREAFMRRTIREEQKAGRERIAVVCGAWHAPVLAQMPAVSADNNALKGMPRVKVAATWIPWTHRRLSRHTRYGAGVRSPGWYEHLWKHREAVTERWLTRVARLLRDEGLDASSAQVIDTVRLSEALAALRGRAIPGLDELNEAIAAALCEGDPTRMALVDDRLIVGERLGEVPADAPTVPLQRDLQQLVKRLRLRHSADDVDLDLDLRKPLHLERSHLLHRLGVLDIPWGRLQQTHGKSGSFHELWRLQWHPEFEVRLIEAAAWGNTVAAAATARVVELARQSQSLRELTTLIDHVLLGDLPQATAALVPAIQNRAAVEADVAHLMDAFPPLAGVLRYGNVRRSDGALVSDVVDGLAERICVGLPPACASLDPAAATDMTGRVRAVHSALTTLRGPDERDDWYAALQRVADAPDGAEIVAGAACRLLLDAGVFAAPAAGTQLALALSRASEPVRAAAWIEGFLSGSGAVLLHDERLWSVVDEWVCALGAEHFREIVPVLRRTFSGFPAGERRLLGAKARAGGEQGGRATAPATADFDQATADHGLQVVELILRAAREAQP